VIDDKMNINCIFLAITLIALSILIIFFFAFDFIVALRIGLSFINLIIALFVFSVFVYTLLKASEELNKCLKNGEHNGRTKKRN